MSTTCLSLADRFWSKVNKNGPVPAHAPELGPCWVWMANALPTGYGLIKIGTSSKVASRIAWEMENGPIPMGKKALHKCDNPPCVRPSHLYLGTQLDNARDRDTRGRNGLSKLTISQVKSIRAMVRDGSSQRASAIIFGVSEATVSEIISGTTWRNI